MMVSVQQAACNALQAYLQPLFTDAFVDTRWPDATRKLPPKAITIICAGQRQDTQIDPFTTGQVNLAGGTAANYNWQIKACEQPLQLDVWGQTDVSRDDLIARLDIALNAGLSIIKPTQDPVDNGVVLQVADGWPCTFADFLFENPDLDDTPDNVNTSEFRATYRGSVNVMLTVTKQSARQLVATFKARLTEQPLPDDPNDTYDFIGVS
jgi:hypothetical protein